MYLRQQDRNRQLSLFEKRLPTLHPDATGIGGTETGAPEAPKGHAAWERKRALTQYLMEEVADPSNLNQALKRVIANKGAPGVDGMSIEELNYPAG